MTENDKAHWGFLSEQEIQISKEFMEKGYLVVDVESHELLKEMFHTLVDSASSYLGVPATNEKEFLNQFHKFVNVSQLNDVRLHLIKALNSKKWFRNYYWSFFNIIFIHFNNLCFLCKICWFSYTRI